MQVVGRQQRLTPTWLVRRELIALAAGRKVALNNAAFVSPGGERVTVMQNALHYLTEDQASQMASVIPRSMLAQAGRRAPVRPAVGRPRRALHRDGRAGGQRAPRGARPRRGRHPIAPDLFPTGVPRRPTILCPIIFQPYKRMDERLNELVAAVDAHADPEVTVAVTAAAAGCHLDLAGHPRVVALGRLAWAQLRETWAGSAAVYFPTGLEAFGFPLAEGG